MFLFLVIAVLILWQMLLPGYVLTLDMVFTPQVKEVVSAGSYLNSLPIHYLIQLSSLLLPIWVIQKIILFFVFFCLGYLPYRFLPLPKNNTVRLFSALVYTANPFVYSRFLAGHWTHLMAYALLPVFIHFLFKFTRLPGFKLGVKLFSSVILISLFSLHFFVMVVLIMAVWFFCYFVNYFITKKYVFLKLTLKSLILAGLVFLVLSAYWLIPRLNNNQPIENRFDITHWQAFAASSHNGSGTTLNVLSLNGFWGEGQPWSKQFAWPQDYAVFWIAIGMIWLLVLTGIINGFRNREKRPVISFFLILGITSFIFATGAGETVFKSLNIWLYEHIYFWRGFRDSQKFSGLLALSYAVLSGYGVNTVRSNRFRVLIFLIPVSLGFLMWGGFKNQLRPVWYPEVWDKAKGIIQADSSDYKVLFLPWHGYLSFNFNNNLLIANPAKGFFGEKAIVSRSVEIKELYDQEVDPEYISLDKVVRSVTSLSPDQTIDYLINKNIKYIVFFQDLNGVDNLKYGFLTFPNLKEKIRDKKLIMYEITSD
jgi:hypothetical protein